MLLDLFKEKRCFKLVCGAGNEDEIEVEKLVALYSLAGCNFFDISAKPEIVDAAKRGLKRSGIFEDRFICCSVGIQGDPHVSKAFINKDMCAKCGICKTNCMQNAINNKGGVYEVNEKRCIGCKKCISNCPMGCIDLKCEPKDLKEIIPPLIKKGIDCIEFHAQGVDENEVDTKWKILNEIYDGPLSINLDRTKIGDDDLINRAKRMLGLRKPYTTIIQADGTAMSGGVDNYRATLQAVATAELFQRADLPIYLMLSGGTNTKTSKLAKTCEIDFGGVAIGSFARKLVREFIDRKDFFENKEVFDKALELAKNLVDKTLENM